MSNLLLEFFREESSLGIDHAEEMELLLENYYMQVEIFISWGIICYLQLLRMFNVEYVLKHSILSTLG